MLRKKKTITRILVIQTAKIGDLICSTPVFREVKQKYSNAHLAIITNPVTRELLENNPYVDEIITIRPVDYKGLSGKIRLSNLIRKGQYDIAICLNPNVPFALALFWGLVPVRLSIMPNFSGLTFKLASVFFTYMEKHASGQLITETYVKMLNAVGIKSNDISKEAYKSKSADIKTRQILGEINKPLIGIAVSSGNKLKELGIEKITELINMLLDRMEVYIVLIGSGQDRETADAVVNTVLKKDRITNTTGKLTLSELPALVERLSLFIGVDTGITYMADALSIPIVHIAGPIDTSEQRSTGENVIVIQNKLSCVPCTYVFKAAYFCKQGDRDCIQSITVDDLFNASKFLLLSGK